MMRRREQSASNLSKEDYTTILNDQNEESKYRTKYAKLRDQYISNSMLGESSKHDKDNLSKSKLIDRLTGYEDLSQMHEDIRDIETEIEAAKKRRDRIEEINGRQLLPDDDWHKVQLLARREFLNGLLPPVKEKVQKDLVSFKDRIRQQNDALSNELKDLYDQSMKKTLINDIHELNMLSYNRNSRLHRSNDDYKLRRLYKCIDIYNQPLPNYLPSSHSSSHRSPSSFDVLDSVLHPPPFGYDEMIDRRMRSLDQMDREIGSNNNRSTSLEYTFNIYIHSLY